MIEGALKTEKHHSMNKLAITFALFVLLSLTSCISTRYAGDFGTETDDLYYTSSDDQKYDMSLRHSNADLADAPVYSSQDDYYDPNAPVDINNQNNWNQNNISPNFQDPFFSPTSFRFGVNYNSWFFRWHPNYMGYGYGHYYPFNSPFYGGQFNTMCNPWFNDPWLSPYYYSPGTLWANNYMNYWYGWNNGWNNGWAGAMDGNGLFMQNRHFGHRESSGVNYANNSTYGSSSTYQRPRDIQVRVPNVNVPRPNNVNRDDIKASPIVRTPVVTRPTDPDMNNSPDRLRDNSRRNNSGNSTTRPSNNTRPSSPSVTPRSPQRGGNSGRTGGSTTPSRSGGSSTPSRGGGSVSPSRSSGSQGGGSRSSGSNRSGSSRNPR